MYCDTVMHKSCTTPRLEKPNLSSSLGTASRSLLDHHLVTSLGVRWPRPRSFRSYVAKADRVFARFTLSTSATVRMISRVHGHSTTLRPEPEPTHSTRFAQITMLVIRVRHCANRSNALEVDQADFT